MVILGLTLKNILAAEVWPEHKNPGCYGGAGFKITCFEGYWIQWLAYRHWITLSWELESPASDHGLACHPQCRILHPPCHSWKMQGHT